MSGTREPGHWLRFIGFGLIAASLLTFDAILLLWLFGAAEVWQWASVVAGAGLLVVGTALLVIGRRLR